MRKNFITEADIKDLIERSEIHAETIFDKVTVVSLKLPNNFIITESSACVDPNNYDFELGKKICLEKIENKLWELEGYRLACKIYEENPIRELDDLEHFIE